jgi:hypothetical protein
MIMLPNHPGANARGELRRRAAIRVLMRKLENCRALARDGVFQTSPISTGLMRILGSFVALSTAAF